MPVTLSGVFSSGLKRAGEPPVPEESGRHSSLKAVGSFSEQLHLKGDDMKSFFAHVALAFVGLVLSTGAGCPGPGDQGTGDPPTTLTISLYNDSCGTYISPRFAVCPKGMAEQPHYFVEPPVVLAPGQSVTYKTDQVAGATDGDCAAFSTAFMVGIPGWGYGPTSNPDIMTYVGMPDDSAAALQGLDLWIVDALRHAPHPAECVAGNDWARAYSREQAAYEKIRREIAAGGRAYFIYPLVNESENVEAKSAIEFAERLKNEHFPEFRVGLVHGQMSGEQKEDVMARFRAGEIDILAATVVVEVGVDVPEANVMVIENAERFGLAQLHQLRGRVGRGQRQSFLYLFGDPRTEDAIKRLNALCATNDGFKIAEEDLKMRGFGDFAGTRQSGVPKLHAGDFEKDLDALAQARKDAALFGAVISEENVRDCLELHFGREFRLMDV